MASAHEQKTAARPPYGPLAASGAYPQGSVWINPAETISG